MEKCKTDKTITVTMPDGTKLEGTAEELAKLSGLLDGSADAKSPDILDTDGEEEVTSVNREAKVGEKIIVVNPIDSKGKYEKGDILTVNLVWDGGVDVKEISRDLYHREYEVIAGQSSEQTFDKPTHSVGDYVKVIGETYYGDIKGYARIHSENVPSRAGEDFEIRNIFDNDWDYVKAGAIEPVDDADIPFLKAGREPGEYEKGDVVRIIKNRGTHGYTIGDITELVDVKEEYIDIANAYEGAKNESPYLYRDEIELIAPAHARVDGEYGE